MNLDHKSLKFELKLDSESRTIEGYGSVFGNVDHTNDIVLPGAFAESLKARKPKMLYQHDSDDLIGVWDAVYEDGKGLYVKGRIANTECGNNAYELAKMGALDSMSIGYRPVEFEYNKDGIRELKKVELYEVSLVTFPSNEKAVVTAVKSSPENERDFERFLRDEGKFSREAAKIITAHGFKALSGQRDVEASEVEKAAKKFADFLHTLKH